MTVQVVYNLAVSYIVDLQTVRLDYNLLGSSYRLS